MNENYEYVFFKYLYKKLELNKLDEYLVSEKIKMIDYDNSNNRISKYFALENQGNTDLFSDIDKKEFNQIFNDELNNIIENKYDEAVSFIERTYQDYFHLNDNLEYKYFGPINDSFLVPSNCIVIGLNYKKFDIDENNYDKEFERQQKVIVRILNYIQNELSKEKNIRLASLEYNEVTLSQPFVKL